MDLEKKSCEKCNKGFEDGHILIKNNDKLYHHMAGNDTPPLVAITSCSLVAQNGNESVGVYYKNKFYDLEKNSDKLGGINVSYRNMIHDQDSICGHTLIGDLSFLDKLEPD